MRRRTALAAAVVVAANVCGNFLLSYGMKRQGAEGFLLAALVNPWVLGGIALLIVWTLSRMALLSMADLSYVLPVTAVGYPLTALMGRIFFDERISPERWLGTALILAGMILAGRTAPRTTP